MQLRAMKKQVSHCTPNRKSPRERWLPTYPSPSPYRPLNDEEKSFWSYALGRAEDDPNGRSPQGRRRAGFGRPPPPTDPQNGRPFRPPKAPRQPRQRRRHRGRRSAPMGTGLCLLMIMAMSWRDCQRVGVTGTRPKLWHDRFFGTFTKETPERQTQERPKEPVTPYTIGNQENQLRTPWYESDSYNNDDKRKKRKRNRNSIVTLPTPRSANKKKRKKR